MIESIDAPEGVLAFRAVGEVRAADYDEVLRPALEAAREHGKLRMVYVLGPEFDSYSAGAALEDAKLGLWHPGSWERVAIVTSHDALRHAVKAFGWMIPGEVAVFEADALDEALAWAAR